MKNIGTIMKNYRRANNITQIEFIDQINKKNNEPECISKGYLSALESGIRRHGVKEIVYPTLDMLQKLAIGMGIKPITLVEMIYERIPDPNEQVLVKEAA